MPSFVPLAKNHQNVYKPLKQNAAGELLCGLDSLSGAPNNDLGDGAVKLQVYPYLKNPSNQMTPAKCDANGHLEIAASFSNDSMVIKGNDGNDGAGTARTLKTDSTGAVAIDEGLQGAGNNNLGDGSVKLQVYPYGRDSTAGQMKPLKVDTDGRLHSALVGNTVADGTGTAKHLLTDTDGHLQVDIPNISKGDDVVSSGGLQQVLMYGKKPDGTLQPLETNGDRLLCDMVELNASGQITTSTALASVQVCGYDTTTTKFKTLNVDSTGSAYVNDLQGRFGMTTGINAQTTLSGALTETKQVVNCGLDDPTNATKITPMKVDNNGNLQVAVVSMSGGGDASAANQTTAINHLNEIEGAVETIEACVTSDKLAVSNVQLPATLGQKANASSLATCRSTTTGAYDMSGRTTIGTASTSTKVLCNASGNLITALSTLGNSTRISNVTLDDASTGTGTHNDVTFDLGSNHNFSILKIYINLSTPPPLSEFLVQVSADGTNWLYATGITTVSHTPLSGSQVYYGNANIAHPPRYVRLFNEDASSLLLDEVIAVRSA